MWAADKSHVLENVIVKYAKQCSVTVQRCTIVGVHQPLAPPYPLFYKLDRWVGRGGGGGKEVRGSVIKEIRHLGMIMSTYIPHEVRPVLLC